MGFLWGLLKVYIAYSVLYQALKLFQPSAFFVFDEKVVHGLVLKAIAHPTTNTTERVEVLMDLLRAEYPGRIADRQDWMVTF